VLENFLYGGNYLHPDEMKALYVDFKIRHKGLKPRTEEFKLAIMNDPYFRCLKIKYGYAVTCHKAQGGEWENVFTVWDYLSTRSKSFYRWAYTAVTRASKTLFAIDPPYFNSYSSMTVLDTTVTEALKQLSGTDQQVNDIEPDDLLLNQMVEFGLMEQPILIQDHFVGVRQAVRKHFIEISGWQKKNLEIFYQFHREESTAGFKTWINKETKFNGKFMIVPSLTNNETLAAEVGELIRSFPQVTLNRNTSDTVLQKIEFELDIEEQFPFTRNLYDDLCFLITDRNIAIENIDHLSYRERYTFKRGEEKGIIDFEYDKSGFFGRVLPLESKSNSTQLLTEVLKSINQLKNKENASKRD
jgi:hypothetical protein